LGWPGRTPGFEAGGLVDAKHHDADESGHILEVVDDVEGYSHVVSGEGNGRRGRNLTERGKMSPEERLRTRR
jgi:hypothetical protein